MKVDVIIIGAGPNGLAAGAYLSKAGLKVLLLEKRLESGGGLATEEITWPGFYHNTHAVFMMMADYAPIYADLELEQRYHVRHIYPALQVAMPVKGRGYLCLYADLDRTCESLARFSPRDAQRYWDLSHEAKELVEGFIAPATYWPCEALLDQIPKLESSPLGKKIVAYSEKTARQIVEENFEDESIRALMIFLACHWGVAPEMEGVGYLPLLYLNRATNYRLVAGGSHMVAQALGKIIHQNQGLIINNVRIQRIVVKDGTAQGVLLENGDRLEADKAVISTIDPHQTFLTMVGEENLDDGFRLKVRDWEWETYSFFEVHLALKEPPLFDPADAGLNRALLYVLGYESLQDYLDEYQALERGELSPTFGLKCSFPSLHDPSQAPPGRATGIINMHAPYRLKEGPEKWYSLKFKEQVAERTLALLARHAPNITEEAILQKYITTPLDLENKFSDMVEGSFKQGAYTPFQMGYFRPNDECSQTRTPVRKLYVGGSSCYPGGLVIWGPGYLVARAVVEDLGITTWWPEPEMVRRARDHGLL